MLVASSIAKRIGNVQVSASNVRSTSILSSLADNGVHAFAFRHRPSLDPYTIFFAICYALPHFAFLYSIHGCGAALGLSCRCRPAQ